MAFGVASCLRFLQSVPHVAATILLALGTLVHFFKLGDLPSPAGDETNWLQLGLGLSRGEDATLTEDAQFVSRALGLLIAAGFRIAEPSVFVGRAMPVLVLLATTGMILFLSFERRAYWLGLICAGIFLFHPWSLAWSRTVSVPYSLSLSIMMLTPIAWVRATERQDSAFDLFALIFAMQLWALSLHFSPLGALAGIACLVWTVVSDRRTIFLSPRFALASLLAIAHAYPLVAQALSVRGLQKKKSIEFTLERLETYLAVLTDYVTGESTIRHFSSARLYASQLETLRTFAALWVLALFVFLVVHVRIRRAPLQNALAGLTVILTGGTIVGLALALAGARPWWLPGISADRYGFVIVACLCLACASAAQINRIGRAIALGGVLLLIAIRLPVFAHAAWQGGMADTGSGIENGGGWRGWRVTEDQRSTTNAIWAEIDKHVEEQPLTVLAYGFGFQMLCFEASVRNHPHIDCKRARKSWRKIPTDHTVALAVWHEEAFARQYSPSSVRRYNNSLRTRFLRRYKNVVRHRVFKQADGQPLFELYIAKRE